MVTGSSEESKRSRQTVTQLSKMSVFLKHSERPTSSCPVFSFYVIFVIFLYTGGEEEGWKAAKISREPAACSECSQVNKNFLLLFWFYIKYIFYIPPSWYITDLQTFSHFVVLSHYNQYILFGFYAITQCKILLNSEGQGSRKGDCFRSGSSWN